LNTYEVSKTFQGLSINLLGAEPHGGAYPETVEGWGGERETPTYPIGNL